MVATPIVSTQDGPRIMAVLPSRKRRKAMKVLAKTKDYSASGADTDLAFRYRHGWIKLLLGGGDDKGKTTSAKDAMASVSRDMDAAGLKRGDYKGPTMSGKDAMALVRKGMEEKSKRRGLFHGPDKSPYPAMRATEARYKADEEARKSGLPSQSEFDRGAAEARARKAAKPAVKVTAANAEALAQKRYYALVKKHGRGSKQAEMALKDWHRLAIASGRVEELSTPVKGETDLAFNKFMARRKTVVVPPHVPKAPATPKPATFRPAPGREKTKFSQGALAKRASKPGHYRAKAILAAQSGNMQAAKRFEAKRAVAHAMRQAPAPAKPHPAAVFRPPGPRAPATPKPFKPGRKPKGPR